MADLTVANTDSGSETALSERRERDIRGRFIQGNTAGWKRGQSGNPSGKSSLRRHLEQIGEQTVTDHLFVDAGYVRSVSLETVKYVIISFNRVLLIGDHLPNMFQ